MELPLWVTLDFPLSPLPQCSTSFRPLPLLDACSSSSSLGTTCYDVKPQVLQPPSSSERENRRPVGSLLAPPTLGSTRDPCGSTPPCLNGSCLVSHHSSFPSAPPVSWVTPAPPQSSGTLTPTQKLIAVTPPRSPVPAVSLCTIGSLSAPWDPSAPSLSVISRMPSATVTTQWLLPLSRGGLQPRWAVIPALLWVCVSRQVSSSTLGVLSSSCHHPFACSSCHPFTISTSTSKAPVFPPTSVCLFVYVMARGQVSQA